MSLEEDIKDFISNWYLKNVDENTKNKFEIYDSGVSDLFILIENEIVRFSKSYKNETKRLICAAAIANTIINISRSTFLKIHDKSCSNLANKIQDNLSCDMYLHFLFGNDFKYITKYYEDINKAFQGVNKDNCLNHIGMDIIILLSKLLNGIVESKKPFYKKLLTTNSFMVSKK